MLDAWTAGGRWTCPDYEEDEARRTASFLDVYLESCTYYGGGVTKNFDLTDKNNIAVLITKIHHIQFFNRVDNGTILGQVNHISDVIRNLSVN